MIYDYIIHNYKECEPIFFDDLLIEGITRPSAEKQLKTLCAYGKLMEYENISDVDVYYIPKKSLLKSPVGPTADMIAKYRFISKGGHVDGFYTGNTFANQLGISAQVPRVIEIVSNHADSTPHEIEIGKRKFFVKKPIETVTANNVYVLQMLELLKNLDTYLDDTYEAAAEKFSKYIHLHEIKRSDLDKYIRKYPAEIFKNYYELELDHVLA